MGRSSTRKPHPIVEKLRNDLELIESVANSGVVDVHDLGDENDELKDIIEDLTQRLQKKENQLLIKTNEVEGHWIGSTECRRKLDDAVQANVQLHAQLQGTKDHSSELSKQLGNSHGYIAVLKEELVRLGSLHTENASLKLQIGNLKRYILNPPNTRLEDSNGLSHAAKELRASYEPSALFTPGLDFVHRRHLRAPAIAQDSRSSRLSHAIDICSPENNIKHRKDDLDAVIKNQTVLLREINAGASAQHQGSVMLEPKSKGIIRGGPHIDESFDRMKNKLGLAISTVGNNSARTSNGSNEPHSQVFKAEANRTLAATVLKKKGKLNPECVPFYPSMSKSDKVSHLNPFSEPFVPPKVKLAARVTPPHKRIPKPNLTLNLNGPPRLDLDTFPKLELKSDDSIATATSKYTIGISMEDSKEVETSIQPQSTMASPPEAKNESTKTEGWAPKTSDKSSDTKVESTIATVKPSFLPHLLDLPAKTKVTGIKTPEFLKANSVEAPATQVTVDALRPNFHAEQVHGGLASDTNTYMDALEKRHRVQAASIQAHMPIPLPEDSLLKSWLDNLEKQSNTQPSVSAPLQGGNLIDLDFDEESKKEATAAGAFQFTPEVTKDLLDQIKNTVKVPTGSQHPAQDGFQVKVLTALEQLPFKVGDGSNITAYLQDLLAKMKVELNTPATARSSPTTPEDEGYNTAASTDPLSRNKGGKTSAAVLKPTQNNIKVPQTYDGASDVKINVSTASEDKIAKAKEAAKLVNGSAFLAAAGSTLNEVAASGKYGKGKKLLGDDSQTEEPALWHKDQFFDPDYITPKISGTRVLGGVLDFYTKALIMNDTPRSREEDEVLELGWKPVIKNGKQVFVL